MQVPRLTVREVNDIDQLQSLQSDWFRLLLQTAEASFFQSLEWLTAYCRHFGQGEQLRTMLVEQDGVLIGIVPLVVRRMRLGTRVVGYPLDSWGTSYGPVGQSPEQILTAALVELRRQGGWDLLDLRWASGAQADAVSRALSSAGMKAQRLCEESASWVELAGSWDEYWMSLTSKWRNNVRRSEKKLARLGSVGCEHYRAGAGPGDVDPRWDLYEMCEQVAGASWQAVSTSGNTLTHETVRNFLRDVHKEAARRGCVSMHLLKLSGQPIAYAYNYVLQGRVFGLRAGYDPNFAQAGPGSVLLARMMREGIRRGDRVFDLGEGASRYKRHWRNRLVDTFRFYHYRPASVRAQAHRLKHWLGAGSRDQRAGIRDQGSGINRKC